MPMPVEAVYSSELEKEWLNSDSFPPPIYYRPNKNSSTKGNNMNDISKKCLMVQNLISLDWSLTFSLCAQGFFKFDTNKTINTDN